MAADDAGPIRAVVLRVFLSSPGDVLEERGAAREAIAELEQEPLFIETKLEAVSWDDPTGGTPLVAHLDPQTALERHLPKPSECDVVVGIFNERMGTPMPERYRDRNGKPFLSGTAYELADAFAAGDSDVLLYRRKGIQGATPVADPEQRSRLNDYLKGLVEQKRYIHAYESTAFKEKVKRDLRHLLAKRLGQHGPDWGRSPLARLATLAALVGSVATAVIGWGQLGGLSLGVRWGLVGVVTLGVATGTGLVLRPLLARLPLLRRRLAAWGVALLVAAAAGAGLDLVTTRPSLLVFHASCPASVKGWRCVGYVPPTHPVDVTIRLSIVDQRRNPSAEWYPTRWRGGGALQTSMQDDPLQVTVELDHFSAPERYGVAYRLAGPDGRVREEVQVREPRDLIVLREDRLAAYRIGFSLVGGASWIALALLYSFYWGSRLRPPSRLHPGTSTPASS